jgi:SnoaL-like protein
MTRPDISSQIVDREAIRDVMMRYARAIDRVDADLLRSVYWPEACDNHGSYNGPVAGFIEWVIPLLASADQTMHTLGNIFIEIEGSAAAVESYFHAYHRFTRADQTRYDSIVAGRYVDRMEKRGSEWRIADRNVVYDWYREYPDSGDWTMPPLGLSFQSNRFPTDISYRTIDGLRA